MPTSRFLHDVRVFDENGTHVIGHVMSVDDQGLLMLSDIAVEAEKELSFMLEDVTRIESGRMASFSATCGSCELVQSVLDMYQVRLNFTHLSNAASAVTRSLH
ncbi:MAG: hypothetical protein CMK83_19520 [Pseudomonadales bacterium]|jgi:hypothetical protein|uniref:hypothetical protein n=1 Tax=unclassified Ketobacter TaxID=2639109 RepID=UPI000C8E2738|nr:MULTISPECIES: hypothetical protein [unclassified Ketobacter]MAQ26402.1 hypothetical protein [Pseudomonadales bacterium]MEC8813065.1 hypothetical protein [Pseudomonadota bacterium]TNC88524.1 MAG: hypothetical protein CSH49_11225 [Alcanivorax sp.]HAG96870.1 hypothetical protein [Gammaproteobacteria bacterium]RLT89785.1 MAG: hypothetical protein D9N13_09095 [Ketobacter sp. GenoA1]|tara:strand:+ start:94 stop:402 length:309 start_codon:yes stop_codon:yes gene_type:complete